MNSMKQELKYSIKRWLFDNRINSINYYVRQPTT